MNLQALVAVGTRVLSSGGARIAGALKQLPGAAARLTGSSAAASKAATVIRGADDAVTVGQAGKLAAQKLNIKD